MNAKLRAMLKSWDREERTKAVRALLAAVEDGNIPRARKVLEHSPLLDHFVPHGADCWSHLAAAAGQWEMVKFLREREKRTRAAREQASLESLLFWAMGYEYMKPRGDPLKVAEHLLAAGAAVDGKYKDYSNLHRAVVMNRPKLVELLIRRGADPARPDVTGESALQIARRKQFSQCAKRLEQAGAPLELPKKPQRPKLIRMIDLRESARKLSAGIEMAVKRFVGRHRDQVVTAIALASIPHEGYVMVSFDTGKFEGSPWDAKYREFAWIRFPDWARAFKGDQMYLIDLEGRTRLKNYNEDEPLFKKMIVATLQSLQFKGAFAPINAAKNCRIGIEMTNSGQARFWRLPMSRASKNQ